MKKCCAYYLPQCVGQCRLAWLGLVLDLAPDEGDTAGGGGAGSSSGPVMTVGMTAGGATEGAPAVECDENAAAMAVWNLASCDCCCCWSVWVEQWLRENMKWRRLAEADPG